MTNEISPPAPSNATVEANRIVDEYARREREVPQSRYSLSSASGLFAHKRLCAEIESVLREASALPLAEKHILDVGCGSGLHLEFFESLGALRVNLAGIDLVSDRVCRAKARLGDPSSHGADIRLGDATALPWPDRHFDIVMHSMMFSSVLDKSIRHAIAAEMVRVLRPDGIILWYDFFRNNPLNRRLRSVPLPEIRELFPGFLVSHRTVTLVAPLARRVVPISSTAGLLLEKIPLLHTHLLGALRRV